MSRRNPNQLPPFSPFPFPFLSLLSGKTTSRDGIPFRLVVFFGRSELTSYTENDAVQRRERAFLLQPFDERANLGNALFSLSLLSSLSLIRGKGIDRARGAA